MTDKKLRIATGTSDFKKLITTSDVYVDQTLFIKEFLDSENEVTLITRPRRWGKSLVLDITSRFFGLEVDETGKVAAINSNRVLFDGGRVKMTSPGQEEEVEVPKSKLAQIDSPSGKYLKSQGKYPVVHISFQDVKATTYQEVENLFRKVISSKFSEYNYLSLSTILSTKQKEDFAKCVDGNMPIEDLKDSLRFLTELLRTHHSTKVIVLVDEYDKPVNNLLSQDATFNDKDLQNKVVDLLNSILTPCGKGNDANLEKMLMVGIFDTVKKTGNSGFNNVQVYGINDVGYGQHFGFSEEEVSLLVAQLEFDDTVTQNIRNWYNGYNIPISGNTTIKAYTPWAVMSYLQTAYLREDFDPRSYWVTSGASDILERLLNAESCANSTVSKKFVDLTQNSNSSVSLNFDRSSSLIKYDLNYATQRANIFSYLLLHSGYLTVDREGERRFRLPNAEVKEEFTRVVESAVKDVADNKPSFCRKILDNLNRPKHIKAIKAISSADSLRLADLFTESGSLRCEDESLNFNYFHIAAIYGNEETFNVLRDNCDAKLLQSTDAYNLKPIDYVHMLNSSIPMSYFGDSVPLSKFHILSIVFCEQHAQAIFTAVSWISGTTLALCTPASKLAKATIIAVSGIVGTGTAYNDYFNKKINDIFHCEAYNRYSSIDISAVEKAKPTSTGQFFKYKEMHQDAYVIQSDHCTDVDKLVAQQSFQIFKDNHYTEEAFTLSVCGRISATAETDTEL